MIDHCRVAVLLLSLLVGVVLMSRADSSPIDTTSVGYTFSGRLGQIPPSLQGTLHRNETIEGMVVLEDTPFQVASGFARYQVLELEFHVRDALQFHVLSEYSDISIIDDAIVDVVQLHVEVDGPGNTVLVNGPPAVDDFLIRLLYLTEPLNSTDLQQEFVRPAGIFEGILSFEGESQSLHFEVDQFTQVPEPGAAWLAGVGLALVGMRRLR